MMMSNDIGIDLGTASILVYIKGKGVVLKEPSVVALDRETNKVITFGEEARLMIGRTPGNIVAVRPLRKGVISDYTVTEKMLKYFINKAVGKRTLRKPRIAVCIPSGATEVERKAVEDATYQAGAREVCIIEEPVAAAIGAGIDISKACGNMIVDIGGGTADIAVISLGGTVVSTSIKTAGDDFDEALVVEVSAYLECHFVTKLEVAAHAVAAQVKISVTHSQVVATVGVVLDGESRHFAPIQHLHLRCYYFDVACGYVVVLVVTFGYQAFYLQHVFAPQLVCCLAKRGIGIDVKHNLCNAVSVAKVNERHAAHFAGSLHPAGQCHGFAGIA